MSVSRFVFRKHVYFMDTNKEHTFMPDLDEHCRQNYWTKYEKLTVCGGTAKPEGQIVYDMMTLYLSIRRNLGWSLMYTIKQTHSES